ncbi:MAG TPA: LLM class flavin-dependent oxidoreductase [Pseudobdellovibrionaceae bacterium]|nr:LLM class flavin-dependent oxidoreductase [Pseudobdellovibrionaceae bacterium]
MKYDLFLSICQTPVDGHAPNERGMFENFFSQVDLADALGFGCAWVAETHLSCQVQKRNPGAVIPHFQGEIGLNTDILQLAHVIFARTRRIHVGSAIRNIICNGGPLAHAEAIRMFMTLHGLRKDESRLLEIGFASGRFPFSNQPYGWRPRNAFEVAAWPALKGLIFQEATEIFLRALRGDVFAARDVRPKLLTRELFRSEADWQKCVAAWNTLSAREREVDAVAIEADGHAVAFRVAPLWNFDEVGLIPFEAPMQYLNLTIGAHDAASQRLANEFLPVGVFNLSITPSAQIEETHQRMTQVYNKKPWGASDGVWSRARMPRTSLVFIGEDGNEARARAERAIANYWTAVEGTLDAAKVQQAVGNALAGTPAEIRAQMRERFHPEDRLMLWFDFNDHDNERVKKSMRLFMEKCT